VDETVADADVKFGVVARDRKTPRHVEHASEPFAAIATRRPFAPIGFEQRVFEAAEEPRDRFVVDARSTPTHFIAERGHFPTERRDGRMRDQRGHRRTVGEAVGDALEGFESVVQRRAGTVRLFKFPKNGSRRGGRQETRPVHTGPIGRGGRLREPRRRLRDRRPPRATGRRSDDFGGRTSGFDGRVGTEDVDRLGERVAGTPAQKIRVRRRKTNVATIFFRESRLLQRDGRRKKHAFGILRRRSNSALREWRTSPKARARRAALRPCAGLRRCAGPHPPCPRRPRHRRD
jgi:hypothetical protein